MASRAPKPTPYHPRHKRTWVRHHDRRIRQPVPAVATFLLAMPALRRDELGRIAERAIDRMDMMDGNADLEGGSYTEWHTREPWTQHRGGPEMATTNQPQDHEDAEDDDPAGQCDEDELNTFPQALLYMENGPGCTIGDEGGGNVEDEGQINDIQPYTGPIATVSSRNIASERVEGKC